MEKPRNHFEIPQKRLLQPDIQLGVERVLSLQGLPGEADAPFLFRKQSANSACNRGDLGYILNSPESLFGGLCSSDARRRLMGLVIRDESFAEADTTESSSNMRVDIHDSFVGTTELKPREENRIDEESTPKQLKVINSIRKSRDVTSKKLSSRFAGFEMISPSKCFHSNESIKCESLEDIHCREISKEDRKTGTEELNSSSSYGSSFRVVSKKRLASHVSKKYSTKQRYRWSQQEQRALRGAVMTHGDRAWGVVSESMRNQGYMRTPKQCRERYRNHDAEGLKNVKDWGEDEDKAIIELNKLFPNCWARIGQDPRLTGRAPVHIRNRFNWVLDVKKPSAGPSSRTRH